mmetsp:Transcript_6637/g.15001  ORF Transcript_6637/g.15001 Transcript_6637/m.15001 type:complete len:303 (+) Transcript_6637:127-1035(+)
MTDFPAGSQSGSAGICCLDAGEKFSGLVSDTMRRYPSAAEVTSVPAFIRSGDNRDIEVVQNTGTLSSYSNRPLPLQALAIPGYRGHIAGKVAENLHGGTFGSENQLATETLPIRSMRRTWSEPFRKQQNDSALGTGKGLEVPSRIPGYGGNIPGKLSETVHGARFAEVNAAAQSLRTMNPAVTCDGWLKRGVWPVDRMHTYQWNNRFVQTGGQSLFSPAQDGESLEMSRKMGCTFGLQPPQPNPHKPGDRYMHTKCEKKKVARLDPSKVPAAGASSYSQLLEGPRWQMHYRLQLQTGCQRMR